MRSETVFGKLWNFRFELAQRVFQTETTKLVGRPSNLTNMLAKCTENMLWILWLAKLTCTNRNNCFGIRLAHGLFRPRPLSPHVREHHPCEQKACRANIVQKFHPNSTLGRKQSLGTSSCQNFTEFAQKLSQTAFLTEDHSSSKTNSPSLPRSLRTQVSDRNSPKFSETCRTFYCLTETLPSLPRNLHI